MKFFVGLDDSFVAIRSQLFLAKPFPPLAKVYSLLLQEESQRNINVPSKDSSEYMAMLVKNANYGKFNKNVKDKKLSKCGHCDGTVHAIDRCFS